MKVCYGDRVATAKFACTSIMDVVTGARHSHLEVTKNPAKVLKILIFDVLLLVTDICTDLYNGAILYESKKHRVLGIVAIGLVWLPGFLIIIWGTFRFFYLRVATTGEYCMVLLGGVLFPIFVPSVYLYALFISRRDGKTTNELFVYGIFFKCLEGIAEATPQLLLNSYFFATRGFFDDYGNFEYIPLVAMIFSILSITKSSTENHFIELRQELPETLKIIKAAPFFLCHVLYRITMFAILVAYLRELTLLVVLVSVLFNWIFSRVINETHVICTTWTSIGAIFSMIAFKHIEKGVVTGPGFLDLPQLLKFYVANSLSTFVIGAISVIVIVISVERDTVLHDPLPEISCYEAGTNISTYNYGRICSPGESPNFYLEYVVLPVITGVGFLMLLLSYFTYVYCRGHAEEVLALIVSPADTSYSVEKKVISNHPAYLCAGEGWKDFWLNPETFFKSKNSEVFKPVNMDKKDDEQTAERSNKPDNFDALDAMKIVCAST